MTDGYACGLMVSPFPPLVMTLVVMMMMMMMMMMAVMMMTTPPLRSHVQDDFVLAWQFLS